MMHWFGAHLQKNLDIKYLDLDLINVPAITLNDDVVQKKLELTIKQYKPDMVIFDPLRNVHSLDEDSASEMSKLLHFIREMNRKYSCSVLLVCHDKKPKKIILLLLILMKIYLTPITI